MAGIYRTFTATGVTAQQCADFHEALDSAAIAGVSIMTIKHDPVTQVLIMAIGVDPEDLPGGVTITSLRSDIRSLFQTTLGRLPNNDTADVKGTHCTTERDVRV